MSDNPAVRALMDGIMVIEALEGEIRRINGHAAGTLLPQINQMKDRIEALEAELEIARDAIDFAHSEGFEWPSDPIAAMNAAMSETRPKGKTDG